MTHGVKVTCKQNKVTESLIAQTDRKLTVIDSLSGIVSPLLLKCDGWWLSIISIIFSTESKDRHLINLKPNFYLSRHFLVLITTQNFQIMPSQTEETFPSNDILNASSVQQQRRIVFGCVDKWQQCFLPVIKIPVCLSCLPLHGHRLAYNPSSSIKPYFSVLFWCHVLTPCSFLFYLRLTKNTASGLRVLALQHQKRQSHRHLINQAVLICVPTGWAFFF